MAVVKFWYRIGISLCLGLMLSVPAAFAQTPGEALQARLHALDGVTAGFSQIIANARGVPVEESTGTLYLRKPDFRWDVAAPYPQTILARGNDVEIYDPDLEQVTRRTLDSAVDQAPLALLTSPDLDLEFHFTVVEIGGEAGESRFELYPLAQDSLFARLRLVFDGQALSALTIFDHVGQSTRIRFAPYDPGQVVHAQTFEIEYPPGTDFVQG